MSTIVGGTDPAGGHRGEVGGGLHRPVPTTAHSADTSVLDRVNKVNRRSTETSPTSCALQL